MELASIINFFGTGRKLKFNLILKFLIQLEQCGMRTPQCTIQGSITKPEDRMSLMVMNFLS